jgi:predicted transcriptional regulator of viral defense system
MNYLEFKEKLLDLACFSIDQVYAWQPGFDRNNLHRWVKKGLLIKLKQGLYTFPEYKKKPDFALHFANRIYKPSYISLHTALSFYGMIPETVVQITSVSPLKTNTFNNVFARYSYKSIKNELMFGYESKPFADERVLLMATPEKAILDLIYLYPEYRTMQEMEDLRLDEDFLGEDLNQDLMNEYLLRFNNKTLIRRLHLLYKTYGL